MKNMKTYLEINNIRNVNYALHSITIDIKGFLLINNLTVTIDFNTI